MGQRAVYRDDVEKEGDRQAPEQPRAEGFARGNAGCEMNSGSVTFNDLAYAGGDGASNPGSFDYAIIFGNDNTALAGGDASGPGSYDGAYVEGNDLGTAHAQGSDYLADILKFYGDGSTSTTAAAAESGGHLTDLLSGSSGAAAEASNVWTELLSAFDGGSAAADASNLWTELASLF